MATFSSMSSNVSSQGALLLQKAQQKRLLIGKTFRDDEMKEKLAKHKMPLRMSSFETDKIVQSYVDELESEFKS